MVMLLQNFLHDEQQSTEQSGVRILFENRSEGKGLSQRRDNVEIPIVASTARASCSSKLWSDSKSTLGALATSST
jgi:hypothetical protein